MAIRRQFDDFDGVALASERLGDTALAQGRCAGAEPYYRTAKGAFESVSDFGGLSCALAGLGDSALATGQLEKAQAYLKDALSLCSERNFHRVTLRVPVSVASLLFSLKREAQGADVVTLLQRHRAKDARTTERLNTLLQTVPQLAAYSAPQKSELQSLTEQLLKDLA